MGRLGKTLVLVLSTLCALTSVRGEHDRVQRSGERPAPSSTVSPRALGSAVISKRTGAHLAALGELLASDEPRRLEQTIEALGRQIVKIDEYERARANPVFMGEAPIPPADLEAFKERAFRLFWKGFRRLRALGGFVSIMDVQKVAPPEPLAKELIQDIRSADPQVRQALLRMVPHAEYSENTRRVFARLAEFLFKRDPDKRVRAAALHALGRLRSATEESLACLGQGLNDPDLEMDAVTAIGNIGPPAKNLASALREKFAAGDFETGPQILFALRQVDANSVESGRLAASVLDDRENAKDPRFQNTLEEAYWLAKDRHAVPSRLPPHLEFLKERERALNAAFAKAIELQNLPEVRRLLRLKGKHFETALKDKALVVAANWGDDLLLQQLVLSGANPNTENSLALYKTSERGHLASVKFLMEHGASPTNQLLNPLCAAAEQGHAKVLQYLLDEKVNVHAFGDAALREAARRGHLESVKILLDAGADPHAGSDVAFQMAARAGALDVLAELLKRGADLHANHEMALAWAAEQGRLLLVEWLLEKGANLDIGGAKALEMASSYDHTLVVDRLLRAGVDVHADQDIAMRQAARMGAVNTLSQLLHAGANVHARQDEALLLAAGYGQLSAVKLLLERGADLHAGNDAALREAALSALRGAQGDQLEIARILLAKGANLSAAFAEPRTDLENRMKAAAANGSETFLRFLRGEPASVP